MADDEILKLNPYLLNYIFVEWIDLCQNKLKSYDSEGIICI